MNLKNGTDLIKHELDTKTYLRIPQINKFRLNFLRTLFISTLRIRFCDAKMMKIIAYIVMDVSKKNTSLECMKWFE